MSAASLQVEDGGASSRHVQSAVARVGKPGWEWGRPRVVGSLWQVHTAGRPTDVLAEPGLADWAPGEFGPESGESQTLFSPELWEELRRGPD